MTPRQQKAGWASSSADLTPAQLNRVFAAVAVGMAKLAAIEAGLPAGELRMYEWKVDVEPFDARVGEHLRPIGNRKRRAG